MDNRIIDLKDYIPGKTNILLKSYGYSFCNFVFEISEKHKFSNEKKIKSVIDNYKSQRYKVTLDDFGTGYSSFKNFYLLNMDYIKIDRFFINGISYDSKKRLIVETIVNACKKLGKKIIGEGVENVEDYLICKELKIDYIQGYLIAKPTTIVENLKGQYKINFL